MLISATAPRVEPDAFPADVTDVDSRETERLVQEIGIPPCPAVLTDFMTESRKDDPDVRRLSHLIGKDVALAASVLKTVNSPFYGLARKADTVRDALMLVGVRSAARLVAGLLLRRAFASWNSPAMQDYWEWSGKVALMTAYLGRELEICDPNRAHTFGLFRDCGIPLMLRRFEEYENLMTSTRNENERRRSALERARYGFDHALVGATLAQTWHLPREMWYAIRIHISYDEPAFVRGPGGANAAPLIALGLLAEQIHRIHRGTFEREQWAVEDAFIADTLGPVTDERLEPLAADLERILEQS